MTLVQKYPADQVHLPALRPVGVPLACSAAMASYALGGIHIYLESEPCACECGTGSEGFDVSAVASAEAAELFEPIEAAFDEVSLFIQGSVIASGLLPMPPRRDHGDRAQRLNRGDDLGRIVALVCDYSLGSLSFEQADCLSVFSGLSSRNAEGYWQAGFVGQKVDLGAQSTSGTPQSLIFGAPFLRPVAACWCARTMVESIIRYWFFLSATKSAKMRSQTPARAQRMNRVCTLLYLPYRSGRSCQRAPERSTQKTPLTNWRLSAAVRPT